MSSISQPAEQITVQPVDAALAIPVADAAAGWINADYSAVVPATAKTVEILCYHPDAGAKVLGVRANGSASTGTFNAAGQNEGIVCTVAVDTLGIIEVYRNNGGTLTNYNLLRYTL